MAILVFDIGGTHIRTALFEIPGQTVLSRQIRWSDLGKPLPVLALIDYVRTQVQQAHRFASVEAIGVSIAAIVDPRDGSIKVSENVGWENIPLKEILEREIGLPVVVDTDAFCGAEAELRLGSARGQECALYIVIGTGIGHALILNGHVWRGAHNAANVFGHLKVRPNGEPCYCGGRGCVCQYASGEGIARLGRRILGDLHPEIRTEEVIAAYHRAEQWANQVLTQAHESLAYALSSLYNLLDVECVIISGGITTAGFPNLDMLRSMTESFVHSQIRPITLRYATFRQDAELLGAGLLAMEKTK